jgi:GNAT superfamily N-acetyltransferase
MIRIRPMTLADVPLGMRLKTVAGWNQVEADWRRMLALDPEGAFVAEWDGQGVGTTMTCRFGPVAWIAMVLVDEAYRGRGVGRALLEHALDWLDGQGVAQIRLDATPLGRPLYEKLGFAAEFELQRFEGALPAGDRVAGVRLVGADDVDRIVCRDREVTGTDREKLLRRLLAEFPADFRCVVAPDGSFGFLGSRVGSRALHLGPCLADVSTGPYLLDDACDRFAGKLVFLDIPVANREATDWAQARGLRVQRPLLRMGRGPTVNEKLDAIWATFGPELG